MLFDFRDRPTVASRAHEFVRGSMHARRQHWVNAERGAREIGVRVALGALRRQVLALVVRQSMTLSLTGAMLG